MSFRPIQTTRGNWLEQGEKHMIHELHLSSKGRDLEEKNEEKKKKKANGGG
jgi:hypothetical protein